MALNVFIRGLSTRGFRVKNSAGARKTVKDRDQAGAVNAIQVDVDVVETQRILSREMDNFIRCFDATDTTIEIRGLHRRGFRIKDSGGNWRTVKLGTTVTVDVANGETRRILRRNKRDYIRMRNNHTPFVTIRGLEQGAEATPRGLAFLIRSLGAYAALTVNPAGANNNIRVVSRRRGTAGNSVRIDINNPGGTAARSINVSGNDITVNLAVTAGVVDATETATNIAAAINANAAASALVRAEVAAPDTGAGVMADTGGLANLTGGSDSDSRVNVRAGTSVEVNADDPEVAATLRRENKAWIEVDA